MITNTVSKVTYTGDGTTKQFQVTFPFIATTDLQLFLRTIATGEYEEIDSNWSYDEGYVTYPVTGSAIADTKQIVIQRNTPLTQEKDHDVRLFTSEDIEGMADKLTQITQELKRDIEEVSSPESIDIDIASAIGRHDVHPQAHYDLFANKVAKTGSTMSGNLTMGNGSKVILSNTANNSYNVFAHETSGGVKQLHLTDTTTGAGVLLDAANSNKPFYVDGSNAYRLLDTSDKTTLETAIAEKADTDLSNTTPTNTWKSTSASWAMPSSTYEDLTLGASDSTYTAPANGWLVLKKITSGNNQEIRLTNESNGLIGYGTSAASGMTISANVMCKAGDEVAVYYSAGGNTQTYRFVYAEGSKSEAN